jgi:excisionase family DNA binding protein
MEQELFKVTSAMKKLDVSRATIYRMAARGELDLVKFGRATRVTGESIDRLLNAGGPPPKDKPEAAAIPAARQRKGKLSYPAPTSQGKDEHEARIVALEREVSAIRKLITKFKEATDECTKTLSAPAGRN